MNPELAAHARLDPAIALWMSFVSRSVQTRRDDVAKVRLRVASRHSAKRSADPARWRSAPARVLIEHA